LCALPLVAAVRSQRHDAFWPAIIAVAVVAGIWGARRYDHHDHPRGVDRMWNTGSVLFVAAYPLGVMIGLTVDNRRTPGIDENSLTFEVISLAVTAIIAALPMAIVRARNPQRWFRWSAWFWTFATILFLPIYYLGFVFLPMAIGCRRAARSGHRLVDG
jgi:uncharacterized membrane protein YgdD (TMEM256/DUF423 family)